MSRQPFSQVLASKQEEWVSETFFPQISQRISCQQNREEKKRKVSLRSCMFGLSERDLGNEI